MSAVGDIPNDCSRSNVDAVRKETTETPAGYGLQEPDTKYVQGVAVAGSAYSRLCTLPSRTYVGAESCQLVPGDEIVKSICPGLMDGASSMNANSSLTLRHTRIPEGADVQKVVTAVLNVMAELKTPFVLFMELVNHDKQVTTFTKASKKSRRKCDPGTRGDDQLITWYADGFAQSLLHGTTTVCDFTNLRLVSFFRLCSEEPGMPLPCADNADAAGGCHDAIGAAVTKLIAMLCYIKVTARARLIIQKQPRPKVVVIGLTLAKAVPDVEIAKVCHLAVPGCVHIVAISNERVFAKPKLLISGKAKVGGVSECTIEESDAVLFRGNPLTMPLCVPVPEYKEWSCSALLDRVYSSKASVSSKYDPDVTKLRKHIQKELDKDRVVPVAKTTAMPVVDAPAPVDIEAQRNAESVIKEINDLNARAKSERLHRRSKGKLTSQTGAPQPCAESLSAYTGASQPRFYIVSKT